MKRVVLIFPDTTRLSQFLLEKKVTKAIVNTSKKSLSGLIAEEQINEACKKYSAKVKRCSAI
jgi:hypothetical protein